MKLFLNATCFHSGNPTGIERFAVTISRELATIDQASVVVASEQIENVSNLVFSRLLSLSNSIFPKFEYVIRAIWDQTCFRYLVAKHHPDLVYFPIQDGMLYPPVKQIVTVHDLHYLHFNRSIRECTHEIHPLRRMIYQGKMPHILEHSAAVIAVSEATKQDIVAVFGIKPDKIHVVYNGYDEFRFRVIENPQPVLDSYGLQSGRYFLYVGSILRHKNIVRLVQAFAALKDESILVLAGVCKDAEYLTEIMAIAAESGIAEPFLRYFEYVADDDLPYLYSGAIAFTLPSLHEGFGVPIIEAMACGTSVITSNCSAMPEVAGDAALLVDPYSVASITAAMQEAGENTDRIKEQKKNGFERAKLFRWSCSAQRLYDVCKSVCES